MLAATIVMAFATAAIAWFNYQLVGVAKDMQAATRAAADAAEAALHSARPFLLVTTVKCTSHTHDLVADSIRYGFNIGLRNFGVGPADIISYIAGGAIYDFAPDASKEPRPRYFPENGQRLAESLIGPGEYAENRIEAAAHLDKSMLDLIRLGSKCIGIDGLIRYRGASEQVYETQFFWWCFLDEQNNAGLIRRALREDLNRHT